MAATWRVLWQLAATWRVPPAWCAARLATLRCAGGSALLLAALRCAACGALLAALPPGALAARPPALGTDPEAFVPPAPPPTALTQRLGATLPATLPFVDAEGRARRLGDFFDGVRPVVLLLGTHRCPNLCGLAMHGLLEALAAGGVGRDDVRVLVVSVDPAETPADAAARRRADLAYAAWLASGARAGPTPEPAAVDSDAPHERATVDSHSHPRAMVARDAPRGATVAGDAPQERTQADAAAPDERAPAPRSAPPDRPARATGERTAAPPELQRLVGPPASIDALARTVGFAYARDAARAGDPVDGWRHPSGLVLLTPQGRSARYFPGVRFDAIELRGALREAAAGRIGALSDRLALLCAHLDERLGRSGRAVMAALRLGGLLLAAALAAWIWRHRNGGEEGRT